MTQIEKKLAGIWQDRLALIAGGEIEEGDVERIGGGEREREIEIYSHGGSVTASARLAVINIY